MAPSIDVVPMTTTTITATLPAKSLPLKASPAPKTQILKLPDLLARWPWEPKHCPAYATTGKDNEAWLRSLGLSPSQLDKYERVRVPLLASLAVPHLDAAGYRVMADHLLVLFLFDDWTDNVSAEDALAQGEAYKDALRNPHRERAADEWPIGRIAADVMRRLLLICTPSTLARFIKWQEEYIEGTVGQTSGGFRSKTCTVDEYLAQRRIDVGMMPLLPMTHPHFEIPDDIIASPVIDELQGLFCDLFLVENDVSSYKKELLDNDGHNLVAVVMRNEKLDAQAALDWMERFHDDLVDRFLAARARVPVYEDEEVNRNVHAYVEMMGNWVRANEVWSFESERYFGKDGKRVQRERTIEVPVKE